MTFPETENDHFLTLSLELSRLLPSYGWNASIFIFFGIWKGGLSVREDLSERLEYFLDFLEQLSKVDFDFLMESMGFCLEKAAFIKGRIKISYPSQIIKFFRNKATEKALVEGIREVRSPSIQF